MEATPQFQGRGGRNKVVLEDLAEACRNARVAYQLSATHLCNSIAFLPRQLHAPAHLALQLLWRQYYSRCAFERHDDTYFI